MVRVGGGDCVEDHPAGEDRKVDANEEKTACEAGDGIAQAFGWGAANEEILFVFRDEVDVLFDVALGHAEYSFLAMWMGFGFLFDAIPHLLCEMQDVVRG